MSMKRRYRPRVGLRVPVIFASQAEVGRGQTLDLTVPGCLIESGTVVAQGDSLQLEIYVPGQRFPLSVSLAVVRWTKGKRFGVEFIKMHESQQLSLNRLLALDYSDPSLTQKRTVSS
ncbi:MAG TPA: PilZ domain-containing protein [Pyrinomonadaceae bacterium]|nr:PilZ domain-containing protein [Pyrinomonadaceae bacterium]